jgi:hypothetical protein
LRSSQAATPRVQKLRAEYWEKVRDIDPENLVFLDETGVILGLTRTHARSEKGTRAYEVISVALDLMNPQHLKNWFTNCCYCTS